MDNRTPVDGGGDRPGESRRDLPCHPKRDAHGACPGRQGGHLAPVLVPPTPVRYESPDPLYAVMAYVFAAAFGLGDSTGLARFPGQRRPVRQRRRSGSPARRHARGCRSVASPGVSRSPSTTTGTVPDSAT
ncbi:hypothetical protein GCM10010269_15730 [Streptomyces humidus]|uniref:Uncharacterized protein n=1 Tax=Streptomyces humidus TaxID=52259 RepID=A0A918L1R7_9ACTN|nr:hypothetical protein GCM10010269_15730 [Streptomyces humidus]